MTSVQIAKICYEVNKAYRESLGDFSQKEWNEIDPSIRNSTISVVKKVIENPDITSEQSHKVWFDYKVKDGWVYGEVKDADKKTHPYLVEYDKIPQEVKSKDFIFIKLVKLLKDM